MLITRNLDVSVGSIMGFAAYLTADFAAQHQGIGPVLVLMPLAIGGVLGMINGLLVAYGRVSPLIATLGTMSLYRGLTYIYAGGQEVTSNKLPRWMIASVDMRIGGVPALVILAVVIVALLGAFPPLLSARPAHLRDRLESAWRAPISACAPSASSCFAYVISGVLCGLAGFLYAARVGTVTVILASGWELTSLAAAVIGGVSVTGGSGTVIGAALGAVVLATIDNGLVLLRVPEFWRMFIQGTAIVAAATVDVVIGAQIRKSLQARRRQEIAHERAVLATSAWELILVVLTLAAAAWSAYLSPYYLSLDQIALFDPAVRLPGPPGPRPDGRRHPRRDRHLACLDPRRRRGALLEILGLRRADLDGRADRHRRLRAPRHASTASSSPGSACRRSR